MRGFIPNLSSADEFTQLLSLIKAATIVCTIYRESYPKTNNYIKFRVLWKITYYEFIRSVHVENKLFYVNFTEIIILRTKYSPSFDHAQNLIDFVYRAEIWNITVHLV